jgi:hypothetical protein
VLRACRALPIRSLAAFAVTACLSTPALADHCPEEKIAAGDPETSLAGVNLEEGTFDDVSARLGPPAKHNEGRHPDDPSGSGWATYEWKRGGATIKMDAEFFTSASGTRVVGMDAVTVSGEASEQVPGTGRGVKLGDGLDRVKQIYGPKYVEGTVNGPKLGQRTITYCFSDETELSLGFDKAGHVVALRLVAPAE